MTPGRHAVVGRLYVFAMIASTAVAARADWTIVVDSGPFATVEAAAQAEEQVDWLDADQADDTACTECFAAVELQRYLRQMTQRNEDFALVDDRKLPATGDLILVGQAAGARLAVDALGIAKAEMDGLGPEGYRIKNAVAAGRRLAFVAGRDRVGTLYGVYDLLYRLGCRWFAPGELGEDVPRAVAIPDLLSPALSMIVERPREPRIPAVSAGIRGEGQSLAAPVSIDVTQRPSFVTRGFLAWENRGDADFLLWMARNRLDYWTLAQEPHSLMHKLGIRMVCGRHHAEDEFIGPYKPYPYDHARFTGDEGNPRDPYPLSPEYQGDANHDGQLSYFEAHPEWYAMVKGKRVPGIRENFGTNYCTSNPHATAEFVKNYVQGLIDGPYREADIVRFWALDVGKWCECAACQAQGTPTDRYLLLVYQFCQEIDKARAERRLHRPLEVTFLAYADVVEPPTRPLPAGFPPDYCMATFYPICRCYVHRLDDPACKAKNGRYYRQLAGWTQDPQRYYRGQMAIGEYYNVSRFKCLPICFMHTMATDIPYYYRAGARTFDYMHVTTKRWGNKALTNYQMARQLWDVQTDCEALWSDYFARRYGPAAEIMRQFYETLEQMLSNANELKYGLATRLDRGVEDLFPTPQLRYNRKPGLECDGPTLLEMVEQGRQCRKLLAEAAALVDQQKGTVPFSRNGPKGASQKRGLSPFAVTPVVKARIAEDEQCFQYGERTIDYYHACVQGFEEARAGRRDAAREHLRKAQQLAELLRADTVSTQSSSSHANAENAFAATGATHALDRLAAMLEPSK